MSYLNDIGPKGRLFCQGTHSLPCANKQRVRCNFNYLKIEIFIKKLTRKTIWEILEITNAYEMEKYLF